MNWLYIVYIVFTHNYIQTNKKIYFNYKNLEVLTAEDDICMGL